MSICYIVGAGECEKLDFEKKSGDIVIAADGGYKYLSAAGIEPDAIIGDFDSLSEAPKHGRVIRLKPEKDITDMDAAIKIGVDEGFKEFHIYGAMGGRLDHTIANIQLIASLAQNGMQAFMHGGQTEITAVCSSSICFDSSFSGYVSLLSHSAECTGVFITGLKYPLENATIRNTFPLGVSNEFTGKPSKITIENGTAIVIYTRPDA